MAWAAASHSVVGESLPGAIGQRPSLSFLNGQGGCSRPLHLRAQGRESPSVLAELVLPPWELSPPLVESPPRLEYESQSLSVLAEAVPQRSE